VRLIDQADLRKTLIRQGFALAQQNTLEGRVPEMLEQLRNWVQESHVG
jgi:hypothetical protein